jgi:hypothetical protein
LGNKPKDYFFKIKHWFIKNIDVPLTKKAQHLLSASILNRQKPTHNVIPNYWGQPRAETNRYQHFFNYEQDRHINNQKPLT